MEEVLRIHYIFSLLFTLWNCSLHKVQFSHIFSVIISTNEIMAISFDMLEDLQIAKTY